MPSNGRMILNTHKRFLKKSRKLVQKPYKKYFVLMLRGAETFCKLLDPEIEDDNLGLNKSELQNLSQEQFDDLYRLIFSYFTSVLTGDGMPGSLQDRISLTRDVVGNEYLNIILDQAERRNETSEERSPQTEIATNQVVRILNISNPDREQIYQNLRYLGLKYVGMNAIKISNRKYCYIATEIYGDYNHSNVILFRKFRDEYLEQSIIGRKTVQIYYNLSPILIETKFYKYMLRKPIKVILDLLAKYFKTFHNG